MLLTKNALIIAAALTVSVLLAIPIIYGIATKTGAAQPPAYTDR